jgi:ribulose-5-phosphate 4-epimerase/fuculose-1-phosphate aldolase
MREMVDEITCRITSAGLSVKDNIMFCMDSGQVYGKHNTFSADLLKLLALSLNRRVIFVCTPAEPYRTVISYLAETHSDVICPGDYETRVLLTDIPVIPDISVQKAADSLRKRRAAVIRGGDIIVASGNIRMAYITFSSVCFACFVKFFSDYLKCTGKGSADSRFKKSFEYACRNLDPLPEFNNSLMKGPFVSEADVLASMEETGKLTVASRLVDSSFGNVSYLKDRTLYISRTGTYLDDLNGRIDAVDLDSRGEVPETVSSEFPVHREIVLATGNRAVLHGHPKFAVILSMACDVMDCAFSDSCQTMCPAERYVSGIPVVPGESGTGPYGLFRKLPPAMKNFNTVIVYGHGLFAAGAYDFNEAYSGLLNVEKECRLEYFNCLRR